MPHLIQILLPVTDNAGQRFPAEHYSRVRAELTSQFGGLTAYTRAPAEGLWGRGSDIRQDDIIVVEIMIAELDREWWRGYRRELEERFRQEEIVMRSQQYETL